MELGVNFLAADNISVVLQAKLRKSTGFGIIANMHITGITPTLGLNKKEREKLLHRYTNH